jgi:hypothetical protein
LATFTTLAERPKEHPDPDATQVYYTSNVLRLFAEDLERRQDTQVLDIGPVCGENIAFLSRRVKRLYVCDMFLRMDRDLRKGLPPGRAWRHLDYPPQSFDGILIWELADRLEECEARRLAELCYTLIRPGGKVVMFVPGEQAVQQGVNTFVIGDGFRLYLRPQPHLDLPFRKRQNRNVLGMMAPLKSVKSFIYRNGLREFLFQHD